MCHVCRVCAGLCVTCAVYVQGYVSRVPCMCRAMCHGFAAHHGTVSLSSLRGDSPFFLCVCQQASCTLPGISSLLLLLFPRLL
ncbi:hypothetical protein FKM82_027206 [Ascaphus truei]